MDGQYRHHGDVMVRRPLGLSRVTLWHLRENEDL
jgi:hypothetical protein